MLFSKKQFFKGCIVIVALSFQNTEKVIQDFITSHLNKCNRVTFQITAVGLLNHSRQCIHFTLVTVGPFTI